MENCLLRFLGVQQRVVVGGQDFFQLIVVTNAWAGQVSFFSGLGVGWRSTDTFVGVLLMSFGQGLCRVVGNRNAHRKKAPSAAETSRERIASPYHWIAGKKSEQ
jgi:hypothetical protein